VEKIILLDMMWPMYDAEAPAEHHMNPDHIRAGGWSIPLETRKNNLKRGSHLRSIDQHVFGKAKGPVCQGVWSVSLRNPKKSLTKKRKFEPIRSRTPVIEVSQGCLSIHRR
jgi:hypothetical protein